MAGNAPIRTVPPFGLVALGQPSADQDLDVPPVEITPDYVWARLKEAFQTLKQLPERTLPAAYGSSLPEPILGPGEAWPMKKRPIFSPARISRMEEAIQWPLLIEDVDRRKVLVGLALGVRYDALAREIRLSRQTLRGWRNEGCLHIKGQLESNDRRVRTRIY
ncbi:DUF6362 family protein [Elstera cyanobacteriorum]|uniref:DUF6362 family protein n=1 Tax=Elstera cyanobacteriorum TaxID=2022747 RepID=UPI002356D66C|nr:DUF6362 family protein [Elstera cyanobacteriorum]MCK6442296.1 DUF6362 family protein [Elstera cyanobacteriorum]